MKHKCLNFPKFDPTDFEKLVLLGWHPLLIFNIFANQEVLFLSLEATVSQNRSIQLRGGN